MHEHLLLGAVMLPLYVKRLLAPEGLYQWSLRDQALDEVFDALATVEPFAFAEDGVDDASDDEEDDDERRVHPWHDVINRASIRRLARVLSAEWDNVAAAQEPEASATGSDGDTAHPTDGSSAPAPSPARSDTNRL